MLRVALTGGIGTGKSAVLAQFRALDVPVVEADLLAHEAIAPGTPGADAVRRRFGAGVMLPDGTVDRRRLGAVVFDNPRARQDLEAIVHPAVYARIDAWFHEAGASGARMGVAEIPLLFETRHETDFDRVVVTACDPVEQVRRVAARGGLTEDEVRRRVAVQWPLAEKVRRADHVIWTDGTLDDTRRRTLEVWRALLASTPAP